MQPFRFSHTVPYILAMAIVVIASNYLVQFPVGYSFGSFNLADLFTYGAFTYPIAFLVTDLTNRRFGAQSARTVVFAGFVLAVILSIYLANPRIAIASGTAFLLAQLLDVAVFDVFRDNRWWKAPLISSVVGSLLDTVLFFTIAFSGAFAFAGYSDALAREAAQVMGQFKIEDARWASWAAGDLCVKLLVGLVMLVPYGVLLAYMPRVDLRQQASNRSVE
ncbi:MAG: queuosine precursor transporter [Pseudomonadota bacterium]